VAAAPVVQRTLQFIATRALFGPDATRSVADLQAAGEQLKVSIPDGIRQLAGDASFAVGSVRLRVDNPPDYPMFINLVYRDDFQDLAELVSGRWPTSTGAELPPVVEWVTQGSGTPRARGTIHISDDPRRFEIAVQESTAQALGLEVGSVLSVEVDLIDPVFTTSILHSADVILAPTELEVTGLYRVRDPGSDAWFGDTSLRLDDLGVQLDQPTAYISAYLPPDAVPGWVSSGLPFEYQWRFPLLVDRLDAATVGDMESALRMFESQAANTDPANAVTAQAGLLPLLEQHSSVRAAAERVLALAATAPLALAGAALAMVAVLVARRRRAAMALSRSRGASARLLFGTTVIEAILLAGGASIAGLAVAIALLPSASLEPSLVAAISIGLAAVILLGSAAWPVMRRPLADLENDARTARRTDPRRLVAEAGLATLAVVGAYLLRERGMSAAGAGLDPFLAAVPPLIALAVGTVVVRLYRPAMAVIGWLANRRRDLVPVLGLRTIARGAASSLPVLVLILAVAFACFTSIVSASIDKAQRDAGWLAVGADARIEPAGSRRDLGSIDASNAPGVQASARGYVAQGMRASSGSAAGTVTFQAVDAPEYASVAAASPVEPNWPQAFVSQPADGPIPAIVGTRLTGGSLKLAAGDTLTMTVLGHRVQMQVVEVRSSIAGLTSDDAFVEVPYAWLEHAIDQDLPPTVMWVRVPASAVAGLKQQVGADAGGIQLTSRYDADAALRDEPLVGIVSAGFGVALAVSVAFAILTILGAVILSAARRTRDVAILRTLGLNGRQQTRLTMLEHAPPILLSLPVGMLLGVGVALVVSPALGLGALSGSSGGVSLVVDWLVLATLSVALSVVGLAAVVAGSWLSRRAAIINALQITSD
jgi:putative ABC transport system permease protein